MNQKFTHLHVHSHYSLLDGLPKIGEMLDYVKELGMDSVALTDHGVMYGIVELYKEAKKRGIKPIFGMETYVAPDSRFDKRPGIDDKRYHLTLLAKNDRGYKNLIKLSSKAHIEGYYYKPRVDKELLKECGDGIIALSGCLNGELAKAVLANNLDKAREIITQYQEIFGKENYYLELQYHKNIPEQLKLNAALVTLGKECGAPLVATQDSHYLKKEDWEAQDILLAIQTGNKISDTQRLTMKDDDFSMKSTEQMIEEFKDIPEAITNTQKIADACDIEIVLGKYQLPNYEVPEGYDDFSYLTKLCVEGLKKRFEIQAPTILNFKFPILKQFSISNDQNTQTILERLDYELSIIKKTGYSSYFLIVQDFTNWAKEHGIVVGPGRGSAAGSLVAYLTNVTNIDPLKYNLLFERFLNPERISMPDIDMDFTDTRRDEVIGYVSEKYGRDHVAQIITFGTMAARVAIRDVGRVLDYEYGYCDKLAKLIPMHFTLGQAVEEVNELKQIYAQDERARKLIDTAKKLEGVVRHASTHACGVVIAGRPLEELTPLQLPTQMKGEELIATPVTQYEMHAVEELGLLKMDFLGLKNLTIIEHALESIRKRYGVKLSIDTIPMDDEKALALMREANTTGCFQLESSGMKRYLKELQPSSLEDIIAMVSLYRPGPMEFIPDFIARKHGKKQITYLHPALEPILKNTYGIAVYQEQVLEIARELAGFSFGEADVLRKAIGKKIKELLDEQRVKFIEGVKKNGLSEKIGDQLFQFIEPFAHYGFNRSHAACYATIAFQTAYLKAHYPTEFMAALLNSEQKDIDRISFLIDECKRMNIQVLPPDINESDETFTASGALNDSSGGRIRFGLAAIKNVGHNIVDEIIRERNSGVRFTSMENFLERMNTKDLNKKSIESLVKAGVFDTLGERNRFAQNIEMLLKFNNEKKAAAASNQMSLFGAGTGVISESRLILANAQPAPKNEVLGWEKELLGLYISSHPLEEHAEMLKIFPKIKNISAKDNGRVLNLAGMLSSAKKIITKSGKPMLFIQLEDLTGKIETIIFPSLLELKPDFFQNGKTVRMSGRVSDKDGEVKFICEEVKEL
ncbi:MAG: DNA polymerase III subunit alpha [Candidatus Spechtbacteria bacterium]|nr:DNA polymerase III subunit alpha [Candidatus Spechtbacteria bacterium]